ncbi:MAG: hypothetical protein K8H85_11145 [Cyclobacteriaceae bacterium]|nr:hypothetical protein [Cyclobacteriaceae bacterium]
MVITLKYLSCFLFLNAWLLFNSSNYCQAQFSNLVTFEQNDLGRLPTTSLITDGNFLYGMTTLGGDHNGGVIFRVRPDGSEYNNLFHFSQESGRNPRGSLLLNGGYLYGMTEFGGANQYGTIFKMNLSGTEYTKLFDFESVSTGGLPKGSLIFDARICTA